MHARLYCEITKIDDCWKGMFHTANSIYMEHNFPDMMEIIFGKYVLWCSLKIKE
jgi:hypothetical protein